MGIISNYRACELTFNSESFFSSIVVKSTDELLADVKKVAHSDVNDYLLVRVTYASISMSDLVNIALARQKGLESIIPGIEFAGTVISSNSAEFPEGSEVVSYSCSKNHSHIRSIPGINLAGAYGEIVSVHKDNLIMVPIGLSSKENVVLGHEGLSILSAISKILNNNLESKEVLVILPKYSIGYLAILLLKNAGFDLTVVVESSNEAKYLNSFVDVETISKEKLAKASSSSTYAAIFDMSGGELLSSAINCALYRALVFICSTHKSFDNTLSVPLKQVMLRNLSISPIEDYSITLTEAKELIYQLVDSKPNQLLFLAQDIAINELPEYLDKLQKENLKGKIIINYEL